VDGAFRVMLTMHIHPGREREFEETWSANSTVVTAQPANLGHTLARSTEDPSLYTITSEWVDEPSFRAYESSAEHLHHRAQLHPYRRAASFATMTVVHHLPTR
jgi:heme oxygenase (mycobilin-producing)